MSLEYPIALIIPVVFIICSKYCKAKVEGIFFPNTQFFAKKAPFAWSLFFTVLFISIALSSPVKLNIYKNQNKKGYDVLAVLDTSGSMQYQHKLYDAKKILNNFIHKRKNDRFGLVVFGNIAYIASPLTYDKKNLSEILNKIYPGIAGPQTAIYDALFLSSTLFKHSHSKNKIIILLTDGMDNSSTTPKDLVIKTLKQEHIKVYAIGLGMEVDAKALENIAQNTNGKFFWIRSTNNLKNELKQVYNTIDKLEKSTIKTKTVIQKHYFFEYPLIIALLFFIWFLFNYRRSIWNF